MSIEQNLTRMADAFDSIAKSLAALTNGIPAAPAPKASKAKDPETKVEAPKTEAVPTVEAPAATSEVAAPAEEITLEQLRNVGIKIASNKGAVDDFKAVLAKFEIPKLTAAKPSDYAKIYPQLLEVCKKHNIT